VKRGGFFILLWHKDTIVSAFSVSTPVR